MGNVTCKIGGGNSLVTTLWRSPSLGLKITLPKLRPAALVLVVATILVFKAVFKAVDGQTTLQEILTLTTLSNTMKRSREGERTARGHVHNIPLLSALAHELRYPSNCEGIGAISLVKNVSIRRKNFFWIESSLGNLNPSPPEF